MKFEGTKDLPSLEFDELTGQIKIFGASTSLAVEDFWQPLFDKMKIYLEDPRDISLTIEFDYFNSSSARRLLDLMNLIDKKAGENKRKFVITWIHGDDEDLKEAGEDFASMVYKNTIWRFEP
jgi:hypothetical protein